MIVLVRDGADPQTVQDLMQAVRDLGLQAVHLDDVKGRAFEVMGSDRGRVLELRDAPGVEAILTRRTALGGGEPLWPHFVLRLAVATLCILVVVVLLSALFPPGLGDRALHGGAGPRVAEWYLRPLAGFLALLPESLGGVVVLLLWVLFLVWPFLERVDQRTKVGGRVVLLIRMMGVGLVVLVLLLALVPLQ